MRTGLLSTFFSKMLKRTVSAGVLLCFPLSTAAASVLPQPFEEPLQIIPSEIQIPEALGQIETQHFAGEGKPFVVFIQDAHAVVDAQQNIRRLLAHLEKEYGVRLVGVEGGEGKLDPLVFKAFPDSFVKEKVLQDYLSRGEITGAGLAAVFSQGQSHYAGIEDWKLYGENYRAYLRSVAERPSLLAALEKIKLNLDGKQKKIYTSELVEYQKKTEDFYSESTHLLEYLQYLRSVSDALNGSSLDILKGQYPHLEILWESVTREKAGPSLDLDASIRRMAKTFQEHYLPRLDRRTQMEFNGRYQQFLAGQMEAGSFLRGLVETGKSAGIQPKLSPEMKDLLGHTERLSQIKGTRLFDELEAFSGVLESALIQNEMQMRLSEDYRRLRRLKSLAHLELSRIQLDQYQADAEGHLALLDSVSSREAVVPALTFYKLALERDKVFHEKIEKMMRREGALSAAVLAGGFHARGFEEELKAKDYSYAVITPRIDSLDGSSLYENVMSGKLSYGQDVTRSLYEAFVRHAAASFVQELSEPDFRKMMKLWRDEILRLLASEGRLSEAGEYTRALDALINIYLKKFGTSPSSKSLPEVLEELDRELDSFKTQNLHNLWERFEGGMERFFAAPQPAPGAVLGIPVTPLIPTALAKDDPVLEAVRLGPDAVLLNRPADAVQEVPVPAMTSEQLNDVLSDLLTETNQGVSRLPAVRELRQQLQLALDAGNRLGAEAGNADRAEIARTLEDLILKMFQSLPREETSPEGYAAFRLAVLNSLKQDLSPDGKEIPAVDAALQSSGILKDKSKDAAPGALESVPVINAARSEMRSSESPQGAPGASVSAQQAVLNLFGASVRSQNLPEDLPSDYFILSPILVNNSADITEFEQVLNRSQAGGYLGRTVFVDDGSRPEFQNAITALKAAYPEFHYILYDKNQQKEVALYAALDVLSSAYHAANKQFPDYFVSVDSDSVLTSPQGGVNGVLAGLDGAVASLSDRANTGAAGIEIQASLSKESNFLEWLQALNYFMTMGLGKMIALIWHPSIPGGGVVYKTSAFRTAVERVVAKDKGWSYLSGPMKLRAGIAAQKQNIAAPYSGVIVKTKVFAKFSDLVKQQKRWWKPSDFPLVLKIILGALAAALAVTAVLKIMTVGILPLAAMAWSAFLWSAAVTLVSSGLWALQHKLRPARDTAGWADLLLLPAYVASFFFVIPTILFFRAVTGADRVKAEEGTGNGPAGETPSGPQESSGRSELRTPDGDKVLADIRQKSETLRRRFEKELESLKPKTPAEYDSYTAAYTELLDRTLKDILALYDKTGLSDQIAFMVTGSLARRSPAYGTDIDVLLLADKKNPPEGKVVEHFVDTLEEVVTAGVDFPTRISAFSRPVYRPDIPELLEDLNRLEVISLRNMLDSRLIGGNQEVYAQFKQQVIPSVLRILREQWMVLDMNPDLSRERLLAWKMGRIIENEDLTEAQLARVMERLDQTGLFTMDQLHRIEMLVADERASNVDLLNRDSYYYHYLKNAALQKNFIRWDTFNAKKGYLGSRTLNHLIAFGRVITNNRDWDLDASTRAALIQGLVNESFLTDREAAALSEIEAFNNKLKTAVNLSWEAAYPGEALGEVRKDTLDEEIVPQVLDRLGMTREELRDLVLEHAKQLQAAVKNALSDYRDQNSRSELRGVEEDSRQFVLDAKQSAADLPFDFGNSVESLRESILASPAKIYQTLQGYTLESYQAGRKNLNERGRVSSVVDVTNSKPTVTIGDLHGRMDAFLAILKDTVDLPEGKMTVLDALLRGLINLHQVGDIVHPPEDYKNPERELESFALFVAFLALKNAMPDNVHMIAGNHESAIVSGKSVARQPEGEAPINLDREFKKAVLSKASRGSGWENVRFRLPDKGIINSKGQDLGTRLYELFIEASKKLPIMIRNGGETSAIGTVHAGPPTQTVTREDLDRAYKNRKDGSVHEQLQWTRTAEKQGEASVKQLDDFAQSQGLKLLINGHTPLQNFRPEKGTFVQVYKDGSEPVFGILKGTQGAAQIIVDASVIKTGKFGYLLIDPKASAGAKVSQLKAPGGASAFRVLDLNNPGPSHNFVVDESLSSSSVNLPPGSVPPSVKASHQGSSAKIMREPRVFRVGLFYFRIQLEGTTVVILKSDAKGNIEEVRSRKALADGETLVIGRDPERGADLILGDESEVSGIHAFIRFKDGKYTLEDPGLSRNGTFAAGRRIPIDAPLRLDFSDNLGVVKDGGVRQKVYAIGTNFISAPLDANGHVEPLSLLVPPFAPKGQVLIEEVRTYIEKYIKKPDQKKWALQNLSDPAILPLILPAMETARRANVLLVISQEIPNIAFFREKLKRELAILEKVFNSLPKELMWEMTAPQGYEYTETEERVRGFQKMDDTQAGGAIGKFRNEKEARQTIVHEILGHKRHNTKAMKFEFTEDGKKVRRLDGPDDWQIIVSGQDWERIAHVNGVERVTPFSKELREAMANALTISFGMHALDIENLKTMTDQEVLYLMRNLYSHPMAYYEDLREILAFTAMGDDLTKKENGKDRNPEVNYKATRLLLLESAGRVVSVPVDPVHLVYRSYEYNPDTEKFDVFYLRNLGDENVPNWHKVLWHMADKKWVPYEATAPEDLLPMIVPVEDEEIPEAFPVNEDAQDIPEGIAVEEEFDEPGAEEGAAGEFPAFPGIPEGEAVVEAAPAFSPTSISRAVFGVGAVSFRIVKSADQFELREEGTNAILSKGPFDLTPGRKFGIGRSPKENEIIVDQAGVSKKNSLLEVMPDRSLRISDLNATNGTRVNQKRINQYTLVWEAYQDSQEEELGFDALDGGLGISDQESEKIFDFVSTREAEAKRRQEEEKKRQEEARKIAEAKARRPAEEYLAEHLGQNLEPEAVIQSLFDRRLLAVEGGQEPDVARRLAERDVRSVILKPGVSESEVVQAFDRYFRAALDLFASPSRVPAEGLRKAAVLNNARIIVRFFAALKALDKKTRAAYVFSLTQHELRGGQQYDGSETQALFRAFIDNLSWDPAWVESIRIMKMPAAIEGRFTARSELRSGESLQELTRQEPGGSVSALPSEAGIFLTEEDQRVIQSLSSSYAQGLSALKQTLMASGLSRKAAVENAVNGLFEDLAGLLAGQQTLESLVSLSFRDDFEDQLEALLVKHAKAQSLGDAAQRALSRQIIAQTAGLVRSVLTTSVLSGEIRILTSSGAVTVELSPEARILLARGGREVFEAALQDLKNTGRTDLPDQLFLPADAGAKEAWFVQSSFLQAEASQDLSGVERQVQEFLDKKRVPLTLGFTAGTPEEKLARQLARMFIGTLSVGRRFDEPFKASKMGYHVNQAGQVVLLLNAASGKIADPATEVSRKSRGLISEERFISPDLLNQKEYLLLADLVVHSPYLYGQLKSKEGFSYGVMDEDVLNGFLGFLNDLAKTKAAEALVRSAA